MNKTFKLSNQLLWVVAVACVIIITSLGIVLPRMIMPVLESNIYSYLREPLRIMNDQVDKSLLNTKIAYIDINNDVVSTSENIQDIIRYKDIKDLTNKMREEQGKFVYYNKTYYYYKIKINDEIRIALTDDTYIKEEKTKMISKIFPIVILTFLIIGILLVLWSTMIVRKIEKLKLKIDNIDNDDFNHNINFEVDDEIKSLSLAIEDMRLSLKNQGEIRNQMYQNISHDFKTPISVIKSYIEAVDDGIEDNDKALEVIKEQTNKLEQKVQSLLYLNKLDYLKGIEKFDIEEVDLRKIVEEEVNKFKFTNKEINFIVESDKKSKYYGTIDNWETILDNLLSNFIRYAQKEIKVTLKNNRVILYNDGEKIDDNLLEGIFTPFRKGVKGQFGLGLSIVKKTLNLMNYDIFIKNEKKGVSFTIIPKK